MRDSTRAEIEALATKVGGVRKLYEAALYLMLHDEWQQPYLDKNAGASEPVLTWDEFIEDQQQMLLEDGDEQHASDVGDAAAWHELDR